MTESKEVVPVLIHRRNFRCGNCFKPSNTTNIPTAEYEQLKINESIIETMLYAANSVANHAELSEPQKIIMRGYHDAMIESIDQAGG